MPVHSPAIRFILIRPRNPNNIGAVARAMANFGLRDLAVVEPYALVWREARSAVGAGDLLRRSKALPLDRALRGCGLVLGASDGRRKLRQPLIDLHAFPDYIKEQAPAGRIAVLFGSEKTGLRNRDLQFCHALVRIPTHPETPSMNLGQAAAVVAYELRRQSSEPEIRRPQDPPPASEQLEDLVRWALAAFDRLDYMRNTPEAAKAERLRRMLRRWRLARKDAALLQAVFKRVAEL